MDPLEVFRNNFVMDGARYIWRDNLWWDVHSVDYTKAFDETAKAFGWKDKWKGWETPTWVSEDGRYAIGVGVGVHGNADIGEDPTEGEVLVGGVDVRRYDIDCLRSEVSVVLQKNVLFSGTVRENLLWGNEHATQEEIEHACDLAQASPFINEMPEKYEIYIEQGGANVSGGQKQRLCIARALLKKPKVLILDDSTSAVDTKTDALIRKAFAEEIPDTTKIIIAQRISSVMEADKIIILDAGEIVAMGNHEELMATSEIYRETYESQMEGGLSDE